MRFLHTRTFIAVVIVWAVVSACAWADNDPPLIWSHYHYDNLHTGQNTNSQGLDPDTLGAVWIFPRLSQETDDENLTVVDDQDNHEPPRFLASPMWKGSSAATDSYDDHFYWQKAVGVKPGGEVKVCPYCGGEHGELTGIPIQATWKMPDDIAKGVYQIYVWVPSNYEDSMSHYQNASRVKYKVYDDRGVTDVIFDQSDGGAWKLLSPNYFQFSGSVGNYRVVVSTETDNTEQEIDENNFIVAADAIKFVSATGMEIYASPTSAEIYYDAHPEGISWAGLAPFVYIGTVEPPLTTQPEASDLGSVYCINSVTPYKGTPTGADTDPVYAALAEKLGTVKWKYPEDGDRRPREEYEGPIEGGVYSSPTLANVGGQMICYVAGMDRQVYAFNAEDGTLLWKGPGITVGEGSLDSNWTSVPDVGAFGGNYHWTACAAPDSTDKRIVDWSFDYSAVSGSAPGLSYAVYAWIPISSPSELKRCPNAVYTITYDGGTADVTVDQSMPANQGKWLQLGSSYFNVSSVTLKNTTNLEKPTEYCIIADAVMIVPDTISAFSYSSPVYGEIALNKLLFAATSGGRIVAFDATPKTTSDYRHAPIGTMSWIYPKVRTKKDIIDPGDMDQRSLGEIGVSPAFYGDKLFVASSDGIVRALTDLTNSFTDSATVDWLFPNSSIETDAALSVAGFTSSPTLDTARNQLLIGSTGGVFYCLDMGKKSPDSQLKWSYPDSSATDSMPLGAFRFSTPTIATISGSPPRAWCGSSDGKIYSFDISDSSLVTERRIWVEFNTDGSFKEQHGSPEWYYEPQLGSPIQGSVALEGGASPTMFVGDMQGMLRWYVSRTGNNTAWTHKAWRTDGELFSSPNITDIDIPGATGQTVSWIYVGGSDGRLYAFSDENGAWGGTWHGGAWPGGDPNEEGRDVEVAGPDTEIQFDIFPGQFSETTETLNPEPGQVDDGSGAMNYVAPTWTDDSTIDNNGDPHDPCILSEDMKIGEGFPTTGGADPSDMSRSLRDKAIDDYLLNQAKKRRGTSAYPYAFEAASRAQGKGLYFEWGETIHIILWNLPDLERLGGKSASDKRNSITFNFNNSSAGENAGSQIRLQGNVKLLKEYTVLDGSTYVTGTNNPKQYTKQLYYSVSETDSTPDTSKPVKRCYALGEIVIRPTSSRPPTPGPGWILTANIITKETSSTSSPSVTLTMPLANLKVDGNGYAPVLVSSTGETGPKDTFKEQLIGINNPLAIRDDGNMIGKGTIGLAWPKVAANTFTTYGARSPDSTSYYNADAVHWNGNGLITEIPTLDLNIPDRGNNLRGVPHGTSSREGWLGVMDRSATSCNITSNTDPPTTSTISRFRINAADLSWRGGDTAIETSGGIKFPWDQGWGSIDYPNIYTRSQGYRKASDDNDPSVNSSSLPRLILRKNGADWDTDYGVNSSTCPLMQPDTVFVSVNVPRFQPANGGDGGPTQKTKNDATGYSKTTQAYVDSDGNREWASGTNILGRPSTYQETYREFKVWLSVPSDPRIEVEEQTIDVGRAPHSLGQALEGTNLWFQPYNSNSLIRQWFKKLTIKNAGNVNLKNIKIARRITDASGNPYDLGLYSDQVNPTAPLLATTIVSSMDDSGILYFNQDPFITSGLGYTLSKARVGDPDPTIMTIPDRRKWDMNYSYGLGGLTRNDAQHALLGSGWDDDQPLSPYVSIQVPITTPIGTYLSYNPVFRDYTIPVFSDANYSGTLESGEAFAAPSFHLKVTVTENQLTGGVTPTTLPQVDSPNDVTPPDPMPRVGDATPAAFKDAETGNVYLYWSSNRMFDPDNYPDWTDDSELADFASAPWFIDRARLSWDGTPSHMGWLPVQPNMQPPATRWWETPSANQYLPESQWPDLTNVMPWKLGTRDTELYQVRHYSPVLAENLSVLPSATSNRTWLAWVGSADKKNTDTNTNTNKIQRDYMLFYKDVTHGIVTESDPNPYTIQQTTGALGHDPSMEKRSPSLAVFDNSMWMFWQGGEKGSWSIFFSTHQDSSGKHDPANPSWLPDTRLRTPYCLASVGSPNALYRQYWVNLLGDEPDYTKSRAMFDIVYSGTSKLRQNSDILMGKYIAITEAEQKAKGYNADVLPGRAAVRLPRVFGEKLERDPKFGFFTSLHLAWVRLESDKLGRGEQKPIPDDWGGYNPPVNPPDPAYDPDLPFIHVVLPKGYVDASGRIWDYEYGVSISATDGRIHKLDENGREVSPAIVGNDDFPTTITPLIDDATGVYTYKYPQADTAAVLGDMLVDFSEGIVRFTKPLIEQKNDDGSVSAPQVYADYTPQTWRLTTDLAADSSPRAFIEKTSMNTDANPGLCKWVDQQGKQKDAPVDRLWAFWRKSGTSIESSTIFYRTFRIGVDVTELLDKDTGKPAPPISWIYDMPGQKYIVQDVSVEGNMGPWEVDRTGLIVWFTGVDERYRSMFTPETSPYFGDGPGPITITYKGTDGKDHPVEAEDIFWRPELPEQSLFGFTSGTNVNEGSIYAFADPDPKYMRSSGTFAALPTSKIWVFWTSTRGGTSDLFWETLSPNFAAK